MRKITVLLLFIALTIQSTNLFAQYSLTGDWEGSIDIRGTALTIITHFDSTEKGFAGTIDIPQQGGQDIPLQNISFTNRDSVQFELMTGSGIARFRGYFKHDSVISGTFFQNAQSFPFILQRRASTDTTKAKNAETLIISSGDISLAGTLALPDQTPSACVILLSGSGPQDRDSNIYGFKPFKRIADHLTKNGIGVFRYDDRGVGESTGSYQQSSRSGHQQDLKAITKELKQHKKIDPENIGLLGHSQGGIIAGAAAAEYPNDISFVVLMAYPTRSLSKIVVEQIKTTLQEQSAPDSLISQQVQLQKSIFDTLRGSRNFDNIQTVLKNQIIEKINELPDRQKESITNPEIYATKQTKQQLQAIQKPSYASFLDYDPARDLQKISVPVLAVYGKKDTQVLLDKNKSLAEKSLEQSGTDYTIRVFDKANHLFQPAETGSVQEYGKLEKKFVDNFLPTITEWIKKHVHK